MKIVSIVSARPNFVKLAALHQSLRSDAGQALEHIIVHTGQHYDPLLSDVFFRELDVPEPKINLEVKGGGKNEETAERTREAAYPILQRLQPDLVLVYGDVSGALGGARAAHELKIPIAHVEAGLRSFDDSMPEEYNRREIDKIAQLLFVTEKAGVENLKKEGIEEGVHFVGNTMIDTLVRMQPIIERHELPKFSFDLPSRFGVVTVHRPSNVDQRGDLERNICFLNKVAEVCPLIFPTHLRTHAAMIHIGFLGSASDIGGGSISEDLPLRGLSPRVRCVRPLGYLDFLTLMLRADFILTDSGGIQEEATFLTKKCFTLRKNTERPCTLQENGGSNTLLDLEKEEDQQKVLAYAQDPVPPSVQVPPLWDGKAGERIVQVLR